MSEAWDDNDAPPHTDADYWPDLDAGLPPLATYKAPKAKKADTNGDTDHTSWWPVDLTELFAAGYEPQQPELLPRSDGVPLLYKGKCHACNGEGESGKSWFLLYACLLVMRSGGHVFYLDFEDTPQTIVTRLLALGATTDEVISRFHYMRPVESTFSRNGHVRFTPAYADLHAALDTFAPELVVIDGVAEAMGLHGLDPEKNTDFIAFHDTLTRPIAAAGAACAYIDHVTKDKEARGKYAIGGVHKFNVIDGAVFSFQPITSFGVGRHGSSKISVQKDRPGQLRQHTPDGKHIADLHLISDPDTHELTCEVRAPGENTTKFRPTGYMQKLYEWIAAANDQGRTPNAREIDDSGLGAAKYLRQARALLVAEGHVTTTNGPRSSLLHTAVDIYIEELDPLSDKFGSTLLKGPDEEF